MDDNRFFQIVWRFNALVIAIAALLCVTIGGYALLRILKEETRERQVTDIVSLADDPGVEDEFILGYPDRIDGTDFVRIPINRQQTYRASYYSKNSGGNNVNFLFLNSRNGDMRWLLPAADQLFISEYVVFEAIDAAASELKRASAIVYAVVNSDTNNDNRLTESDKIAIAASAPDGKNYRVLVENVELIFALKQVENNRVLALYQKDGQSWAQLFEAPSLASFSTERVPSLR